MNMDEYELEREASAPIDMLETYFSALGWAFERNGNYGMAAAEATIIFLILLLWTVFGARIARSKEAAA